MAFTVDEMLKRYVRGESSLGDLREWLALEQWDLREEERELVDEVDGALVDLASGYVDHVGLREHISFLLRQYTTQFVQVSLGDERPGRQRIPVVRNTSANGTISSCMVLVAA
ncbi:MAG TPA: hypothetical protein VI789_03495 [Dehalococcoidia bacterium]|nr:hypothetical protein [Dehalococcoidia bacterium]